MSAINADAPTATRILAEQDSPVLIDFYATWCGPCKQVSPIIDALAEENPQAKVLKVDIDAAPALAQQFNVMSVPTIVVLKADGALDSVYIGAKPKAVLQRALDEAA